MVLICSMRWQVLGQRERHQVGGETRIHAGDEDASNYLAAQHLRRAAMALSGITPHGNCSPPGAEPTTLTPADSAAVTSAGSPRRGAVSPMAQ